jgi:hypothetical protein
LFGQLIGAQTKADGLGCPSVGLGPTGASAFEGLMASTAIARGTLEHLSLRIRELERGRRTLI